jgi:hypothetical protein
MAELQLTEVAAVAPKVTVVPPTTNPLPEMATADPPPTGPATGETEVTTGDTK